MGSLQDCENKSEKNNEQKQKEITANDVVFDFL